MFNFPVKKINGGVYQLKKAAGQGGFTLLELIVGIVLMGIIASIVVTVLFQGVQAVGTLDTRNNLKTNGTLAFERLSRELRLVRCTTVGLTCAPQVADITNLTATELRFNNVFNEGKGLRAATGNLLLRQGSGAEPEDVLTPDTTSLVFDFLKRDGTAFVIGTDTVDLVWTINATITLVNGNETVVMKSTVHPRSFR
ncbi:prepilin-type N-terminal cleavage/methylation domain-containing protein [bacterium]|nr:MAG: prepilin-type N-terminal cleavage/methylation domain-containing protein [bacterium]